VSRNSCLRVLHIYHCPTHRTDAYESSSGQFVYVIRKRIKLEPEKAIFIYVDEVLPPTAALMSAIYEEYKDEDGFLYVTYSGENVSGEELSINSTVRILTRYLSQSDIRSFRDSMSTCTHPWKHSNFKAQSGPQHTPTHLSLPGLSISARIQYLLLLTISI
jgi:hypothetical protein